MSLEDERNYYDVTPHRITVQSLSKVDDYGQKVADPATQRIYRCYIAEHTGITNTARGTDVSFPISAYVLATPVDSSGRAVGAQTPILDTDVVTFTVPSGIGQRRLAGVESYYDGDGTLNNMVLRFT